jgi:hypothetical protein
MISATSSIDGPPCTFTASVSGLAVYLDNWAIIDLAKGDLSRRERFVDAIRAGGDLLFSSANAVELAGPRGKSFEAARSFLDQLEQHWVPIELNPFKVIEREQAGMAPAQSCISPDFMNAYFRDRTAGYAPGTGKVIDLSSRFFRLGVVLDWVAQSDSIRKSTEEMDAELRKTILEFRTKYERVAAILKDKFKMFDPSKPATFTCVNLSITLLAEAKSHQIKKGDGLDFCHAVMGSTFASVATLDKQWKRRVGSLPRPNGLARIYSPTELDTMVSDIDFHLKQSRH